MELCAMKTYYSIFYFFVFLENDFRKMLLTIEQDNMNLKVENATLKASGTQQKKKVNYNNYKKII